MTELSFVPCRLKSGWTKKQQGQHSQVQILGRVVAGGGVAQAGISASISPIPGIPRNIHTSGSTRLSPCNSHHSWLLILGYTEVVELLAHPLVYLPSTPLNPLSYPPYPDYLSRTLSGLSPTFYPLLIPYSSATTHHSPVYSIPHPLIPIALTPLYSTHFGNLYTLMPACATPRPTLRLPFSTHPSIPSSILPTPRLLILIPS